MSTEFYAYKKYALKAAKDLCYPKSVVEELKNASTEGEIARIMRTARDRKFA